MNRIARKDSNSQERLRPRGSRVSAVQTKSTRFVLA